MDFQNNQVDEAKIEAIVQTKLTDKLKPIIIGLLLLYLITIPFIIFFIYNPSFFQKQQISLDCPIANTNCNNSKIVRFNDGPALGFNVPKNTQIISAIAVDKKQGLDLFENPLLQNRTIYLASAVNNFCYVFTYTLPFDTIFPKLDVFPLKPASVIATASGSTIKADNSEVSFVFQIRKYPLKKGASCTIFDNPLKESGEIISPDSIIFNN